MDTDKFDALVHYVCAKCEDPSMLGATKLNKILWYSDTGAYLYFGKSITDATYVKQQFGPVPKDVLAAIGRLKNLGLIIEREAPFFGYPQKQFIALTRPDLALFSADEISLVDTVIEAVCRNHTASSISALTHDHIWEAAQIGEEIPLFATFASRPGELTESDVAWAKAEMARLEPSRA